MQRYVVYSRGLLRTEGKMEDYCDYIMQGNKPVFHTPIFEDDIVSVFQYDSELLLHRTDYITLRSLHSQPFGIKKQKITCFYNGTWYKSDAEFVDVASTLPANQNI